MKGIKKVEMLMAVVNGCLNDIQGATPYNDYVNANVEKVKKALNEMFEEIDKERNE